eukprot:11226544-Prorocentrum_lima.AAC.1
MAVACGCVCPPSVKTIENVQVSRWHGGCGRCRRCQLRHGVAGVVVGGTMTHQACLGGHAA